MQFFLNIVLSCSAIMLAALSFRTVYITGKFFNFSHAAMFPLGAYSTYVLQEHLGWNLGTAGIAATVGVGGFGAALFLAFIRPLIRKGAGPLVLLLASLAIQLVLQHGIALLFGDDARSLQYRNSMQVIGIGTGRLTIIQLTLIASALILLVGFGLGTRFTSWGRQQAAVSEHTELSAIFGINVLRVQMLSFGIASAIAALLGILIGADQAFFPGMGFAWLLAGAVAVIVGGVWNLWAVVGAAAFVSIMRAITVWYLGSAWQDFILYSILFVFFVARPHALGKIVTHD